MKNKVAIPNQQSIQQSPALGMSKCKIHNNWLEIDPSLTIEEWEHGLNILKQASISVQFWIGDLINFGREYFPREVITEVLERHGFEYTAGTKNDFSWVARKITPSLRKENLSYSHHKEVAKLEPSLQEHFLDKAKSNQWSVVRLRNEVRSSKMKIISRVYSAGTITAEDRMRRVEELKRFIEEFKDDMKKVIRDSNRLIAYNDEFQLEAKNFEELGFDAVRKSLYEEVRRLLAGLGEHGKILSF